jgi:hypothetical protein
MARRAKRPTASTPDRPIAEVVALSHGTTKFTTATRTAIAAAVRQGLPRMYAAALAGVAERTLKRWVALGRDSIAAVDEGARPRLDAYGTFVLALIAAESEARAEVAGVVRRAAMDGDMASARWWLERVDGRSWGSLTKVENVRRDEDGDELSVGPSTAEILEDRLATIERRIAAAATRGEDA